MAHGIRKGDLVLVTTGKDRGRQGRVQRVLPEENRVVVGNLNRQTVHEVWHGEKLTAVRELHKRDRGFMESAVCRKCYLPRKTTEEPAEIDGRSFIVRNYTFRIQVVGK